MMGYLDPPDFFSVGDLFAGTKAQLDGKSGLRDGARAWCSDGRGPTEGAGLGTGVPVFYHKPSGKWRDYRTGNEVLV